LFHPRRHGDRSGSVLLSLKISGLSSNVSSVKGVSLDVPRGGIDRASRRQGCGQDNVREGGFQSLHEERGEVTKGSICYDGVLREVQSLSQTIGRRGCIR